MNQELVRHFDEISDRFSYWRDKNASYYAALTRWFRHMVPEKASVFELGSGHGDLLAALKPSKGVGIDISPKMVEAAKAAHPDLTFLRGDISDGYVDGAFDYVIGADVVGFLPDIQLALANLKPMMHARTRLILTTHNPLWSLPLWIGKKARFNQPKPYLNWVSLKQLKHLLHLSGYEVVATGTFFLLPLPIPLVGRLVNGFIARLPLVRRLCLVQWVTARPVMAPEREPSVSIVIPARNEKGNIQAAVRRMPKFGSRQELIFIEGHSKDGTWEEIQRVKSSYQGPFEIKALRQSGKGKADAVHLGFEKATGDILMILDSDLAVAPEDLPRFFQALATGRAEYVQGTRLVYPMEKKAMRPLNWFGNKFFAWALASLIGQDISDSLCGTKCLWRKDWERILAARAFFGDFDPFGDFELIFGAAKLQLRMEEIPVRYRSRTYGETQISRWRDGLILLRMTLFAARKMYFIS